MIDKYIKYHFNYIKNSYFKKILLEIYAILIPGGSDGMAVNGMFLPHKKGEVKLLEVGCGGGEMLGYMHDLGWSVNGLEFDEKCVKIVRDRGINCDYGDLRDQNYPSEEFDALYLGNVIEHLADPKGFISECARIIKPGGRLVCLTPNSKSLCSKYFKKDWRGLEVPRHLSIFNMDNIKKIIEDRNFNIEVIKTSNRGAWYIYGMSLLIKNKNRYKEIDINKTINKNSINSVFIQYIGRLINYFNKNSGEEIIIVAVKRN